MARFPRSTDGAWLFRVVPAFIAAIFVLIVGFWVAMAYLAATTDPKDVAREVGEIARAAQDGFNADQASQ